MRRRNFFALLLIAVLSFGRLIVGCSKVEQSATARSPERIVLIVIDTLRRDALSVYGSSWETKNIAVLAARGQVFPNAYGSFHQTSMSMGAMFTGRTPSLESGDLRRPLGFTTLTWCGMVRLRTEDGGADCIPRSVPGLGERLRTEGYETIGVASNSLLFGSFGMKRGFDDWTEVGVKGLPFAFTKEQNAQAFRSRRFDSVNAAVEAALERRSSDRFFLYVHYMDVHDYPFMKPHAYQLAVEQVDIGVQELLEQLRARDLLEGTTIVLTSDHGEHAGEQHLVAGEPRHKGNPSFEETIAIPLIVAPAVVDDPTPLTRTEDIFRLVLDIAASERDPNAVSDLASDEVFLTEERFLTYRRGRFKSYLERKSDRIRLVDLEADAGEKHDVSERHPDMVKVHRARILELAGLLAAPNALPGSLQAADLEKLRVLGYVD